MKCPYPYLFCANIGAKCPDKMPDGRCKRTEKLDTVELCPDSIVVSDENMGFLIKYLYHIRSDAPRVITTTAQPMETYPNDLYCTQVEKHCPHQTPGGKCKLHENIPSAANCPNELCLTPDMELIVRLLQFVHRDKDKQK